MSDDSFIFVINAAEPIVLHPFVPRSEVFTAKGCRIVGRYGSGEASARGEAVRSGLHRLMEKGARVHFLDKGYYLRLAASAAAFLVVYLFFSIVVRDPVPIVDELLLGGLAAAAIFLGGERHVLASSAYVETIMSLRGALDGAYFSESRVIDLLEAWRDEALALGPAAFYKAALQPVTLSPGEIDEAASLCSFLSRRWKAKPVVSELYDAMKNGAAPGTLLDKAQRRLGADECALAIAYLRLIPLVETGIQS